MNKVYILICDIEATPYWTGKEFSNSPARIYTNIFHLLTALEDWYTRINPQRDARKISIVPLSNNEIAEMLKNNQVYL